MTPLALVLIGSGAILIWAGFTGANLWEETKAVFLGSSTTTTTITPPLPPVKVIRQ